MTWASFLKFFGWKMNNSDQWERADHYLERMNRDPEWVRQREDEDAKWRARQLALEQEERPMLLDLANAGVRGVKSVYDFVKASQTPPAAFPVLLDHIQKPYDPVIREGIARALTDEQAKGLAGPEILRQLAKDPPDNPICRGALANALTVVATRQDAHGIKRLLDEGQHEDVRERLQLALKRAYR